MNKTKIEWCDATWNPITGCLHGCEYCYASRIAVRFGGRWEDSLLRSVGGDGGIHELDDPLMRHTTGKNRDVGVNSVVAPFPFGFDPTLHRYRMEQPAHIKNPRTIFVCSMADMFGKWVPDEWIAEVFEACRQAPQHRYLFLTKNPSRYMEMAQARRLPEDDNFWYGSTAAAPDAKFWWSDRHNVFVSIEPMLEQFPSAGDNPVKKVDWVILGAMTGPGSRERQPKREWVESLAEDAKAAGVPVFMKDSIIPFVSEAHFRRDFPWEEGDQKT